MLWTVLIILLVLWLIGAIANVVLINLLTGRRTV